MIYVLEQTDNRWRLDAHVSGQANWSGKQPVVLVLIGFEANDWPELYSNWVHLCGCAHSLRSSAAGAADRKGC